MAMAIISICKYLCCIEKRLMLSTTTAVPTSCGMHMWVLQLCWCSWMGNWRTVSCVVLRHITCPVAVTTSAITATTSSTTAASSVCVKLLMWGGDWCLGCLKFFGVSLLGAEIGTGLVLEVALVRGDTFVECCVQWVLVSCSMHLLKLSIGAV